MKIFFQEKKKEAQNAYSFIFKKENNLKWNPGEYILLNLPHNNPDDRGVERTFSISSAPSEDLFMITTRYFDNEASSFKKALFNLKQNDSLDIIKPSNSPTFFNANDESKEYIFLTIGIGITPVRSVLKEYDIQNKELKGVLLYGNRDDEYIFGNEIEEIEKGMPNFRLEKYHNRKIDKEVLKNILEEFPNGIFNISGTSDFTQEMKNILLNDLELTADRVRSSSFGNGYSKLS
jgi:ferredoxin-NADP reductase